MLRIIGDPYGYSQKDTGHIQKSPSFNALISAQRKQISYIEKTVAADKHPPGIQPEFHTGTIPDDRDITVQPILPASQPQCSSRNHKKVTKSHFQYKFPLLPSIGSFLSHSCSFSLPGKPSVNQSFTHTGSSPPKR